MAERYVPVEGGRLFVVDEGAGPPTVLLHEGIADLRSWDGIAQALVAAGRRAIRYDRRGFGRSETEDIEFSNRADVVAVLDGVGIERVVLVGASQGGQIAIDTTIEHPDRVAGLVVVAGGVGGLELPVTEAEMAAFDEMERLEEADPPDPAAIADFDVRMWVDGLGQPEGRVPTAIRELVREMDLLHLAPDREQGRPIPLRPPAAERIAELRCPVVAIAGELDVSDVVGTARHLEGHAPDAQAVIVPGVAHMIGLERPDLVTESILELVERLETGGRSTG